MPSIFCVERSLSGLMFPAGSLLTTVEASIHRSTGLPKCSMRPVSTNFSNSRVGADIEP